MVQVGKGDDPNKPHIDHVGSSEFHSVEEVVESVMENFSNDVSAGLSSGEESSDPVAVVVEGGRDQAFRA